MPTLPLEKPSIEIYYWLALDFLNLRIFGGSYDLNTVFRGSERFTSFELD